MSKEMNNIKFKVTKYDMICGLFMSLIIGSILNHIAALTFFLGACIGFVNYILSYHSIFKWLGKSSGMIINMSILRVFLTAILIIPFANNVELVILYMAGYTMHLIVLGYCAISKKGSA
ncbi:MAG: hypothetical protein PUE01_13600 [Clostridiaceae bacterium]|nr:hypothetical protein [Clostridiaceae bacterium]